MWLLALEIRSAARMELANQIGEFGDARMRCLVSGCHLVLGTWPEKNVGVPVYFI